jgi:hypothetical protein
MTLSEEQVMAVTRTARALYDYLEDQGLRGACHEVSALGYVLLREQGIAVDLCLGVAHSSISPFEEVEGMPVQGVDFDHSWLEVGGMPVDVAIARPIPPAVPLSPVLFGHHLDDARESDVTYGIPGVLDDDAERIARSSLAEFMDGFPRAGGLWDNLIALGRTLGLALEVGTVRQCYGGVFWSRRPRPIEFAKADPAISKKAERNRRKRLRRNRR